MLNHGQRGVVNMNIPMPKIGGDLTKGLSTGAQLFQALIAPQIQQAQMAQQWQQHLNNLEIQKQQQERLNQKFQMEQQLHPLQMDEIKARILANQAAAQLNPQKNQLSLDLIRAQIERQKALAEKARRNEGSIQDETKAARNKQLVNSHVWSSMPSSSKENLTALANGLGIRPDVFTRGMTEGKTFEQIASEHGYQPDDIAEVIPKYLATTSNVSQENDRRKNLAELSVIEEKVTEWMAPYARKFAGMSPKQVIDSFQGKNTDDLAKYYAALALQPEIASLRIKAMGGNMSHAGLEDIIKANFGKSKINESQVGPEVYKKMNHYLAEILKEGSQAATREIYGRGRPNKPQGSISKTKNPEEMTQEEVDAELQEAGL